MNKIDKLFNSVCHDCIEIRELGEIAKISTGKSINKIEIERNKGKYPVINSGKEPLGYYNKWNTENDPIGIITRGSGVGSITWTDGRYFRGILNYSITIKDFNKLNTRFLYYILLSKKKDILLLCTLIGLPSLNVSDLKKLKIPLPPIEIQEKIASIIDKLYKVTRELQEKLKIEKELHKKIYNYHFNKLLNFKYRKDIKWIELSECVECIKGVNYKKNEEVANYGHKILRANNINITNNTLNFDKIKMIDLNKKIALSKKLKKDDILMSVSSGSKNHLGKTVYINENMEYYFGGFLVVLRVKNMMISKYLYYILNSNLFKEQILDKLEFSTINNISLSKLKKFLLPLPSLKKQKEIVRILEKLEHENNKLLEKIEKEIELREKEYIYYREKLLNFDIKN